MIKAESRHDHLASRALSDGSSDVKSSGGRDRAEQEEVIAILEVKRAWVLGSGANMYKKSSQGWNWSARQSPVSLSGLIGLAPRIGTKETRPGSYFSPREIVMGQP